MDGEDTNSLLVGRPPIGEALVLAGPGDVTFVRMEAAEGRPPEVRSQDRNPTIILPNAADAP
jgi:hypothetical protein